MTLTIKRTLAASASLIALAVATGAAAQDQTTQEPQRGETVTERQRPELDPLGVRAGSFLVLPKLSLQESYNDNIFATDNNTRDDFITNIIPELQIRSDWNNHALNFLARGDIGRYADHDDEDFEDAVVGLNGRLDILRDRYVSGGVTYNKLHEDRSSPDDVNGINPTEYTLLTPTIGMFNRWNRLSLRGDLTAQQYDFDDVRTSAGAIRNNDDRDRTIYTAAVRAGYEIVPQYEAFLRAAVNTVDYDDARDDNGFERDSKGFEVVAGTRIDLTGVTYGDVFAGYRQQTYDDDRLETASGPTYGASLTWNVTPLTTLKGGIQRTVEETTQNGASGFFATDFKASVDHELLRNLIIGGTLDYLINDYEGISREDDYFRAGAYARYLMMRNLYVTARYNYEQRDSNVTGADFDRNVFLLRLETQL